jgi:hypothetical protein
VVAAGAASCRAATQPPICGMRQTGEPLRLFDSLRFVESVTK